MAPKSRFSAMRKITVLIVSMRTPASGKPRVGYRWSVGFLQPSVYSRYTFVLEDGRGVKRFATSTPAVGQMLSFAAMSSSRAHAKHRLPSNSI